MEFGNKTRSAVTASAAFVATAALLYLGNGLLPRWPLMWLAPLPVLVFALRRPAWQAGLVAGFAWMAGGLNMWSYLASIPGASPAVWFLDSGLGAAAFVAGVLLMRALARRAALWSAWIALPAVWVAFEFARTQWFWPHGSAACIAYTQLNFLPFLQLASLAGPWGMSFLLMLFPTGLALAISRWPSRQAARMLAATVGAVAVVLIFGTVRLAIPPPGPEVRTGLIASDANSGHLFGNYAAHAEQLAAQGAQVVVMPEGIGAVPDSDAAATDAIFQPIADRTGAALVVGVIRIGAAGDYDAARIYRPDVPVRGYNKQHLLPPYETSHFKPGNSRTAFPGSAAGETWGVAICKDMDFTRPAWDYGRAGVGLMLVPGGDFRVDGFWHGHIAVMRAVEDGFSLVRSARHGLMTVADNRGRIVAEKPSSSAPFSTLVANVPAGHSWTLFLLLGDWFGWAAMALAAWSLGRLWMAPASVKKTPDASLV